jgi:hypothetical protein
MNGFDGSSDYSGLQQLLRGAVEHILEHEDPQALRAWLQEAGPALQGFPAPWAPADEQRRLFARLAQRIWDATPLPSQHFRPRPLPKPERNGPCPCGSGQKFKRCCQGMLDDVPVFESEAVWPLVLELLPAKQLAAAIAERRIPEPLLASVAAAELERGAPAKAVRLLEELFAGSLARLDARYADALDVLADAYTAQDKPDKKIALLERVAAEAPALLAADAWQRLASIHMDQQDHARARHALEEARRRVPENPGPGMLEIMLLLKEGEYALAQERGRFWLKRLRRGGEAGDSLIGLLEAVVADPLTAMTELFAAADEDIIEDLREWLQSVAERPVPVYGLTLQPALAADDVHGELRRRFAAMGLQVPDEQLEQMAASMGKLMDAPIKNSFEPERERMLQPPPELTALAEQWQAVYPFPKPFGTQEELDADLDPWEPALADDWVAFLDAHPQAFDCLDILDDLALALRSLGMDEYSWTAQGLLQPLSERAAAIVDAALAESEDDVKLPWAILENRPLLRLLSAGLSGHSDWSAPECEVRLKLLLRLNPNDNLGLRGEYMNALLRSGRDADALALAEAYPNDFLMETGFGQVLALYRLGRLDEAAQALTTAQQHFAPKAASYLYRARPAKPKLTLGFYTPGGADQAWLYREQMREVWQATPGALEWLKAQAGG